MVPSSSRRADIIRAARKILTTRGFDGTSIGDIAQEIGASKAAVYYYFPSKTDFLSELADPLLAKLASVLDLHAGAVWPHGVRAMTLEYLTVLINDAAIARWVDTDIALRLGARPGTTLRTLDRRLATAIAQHSTDDTDIMRAWVVVGGLWRPLHYQPSENVRKCVHEIIQAAFSQPCITRPPSAQGVPSSRRRK